MKKVAAAFPDDDIDLYRCSSDPDSLDAVVLHKHGVALVDGTSPHTMDPVYPAAYQSILNLGEYWNDEKLLERRTVISHITDQHDECHKRAKNFICALSSINDDTENIGKDALNIKKLENFISRLLKKILPKKQPAEKAKAKFRQISALSFKGYVTIMPSEYECYFVNDPLFAGGDFFLRKLASELTNRGIEIIISQCHMLGNSTYEHILIPELNVAFITSNFINNINIANKNIINFSRFYDKAIINEKKPRIIFNRKAVCELKQEAISTLIMAKQIHDELETVYISEMDFEQVGLLTEKIISKISKR